MTPERWRHVRAIFDEAVETDPAARAELIRQRCGNDEELQREVESLLAADRETGPLLDSPLKSVAARSSADPLTAGSPAAVLPERYEILGELGRGGMGIVYKARDRETGEVLALKILKPEIAADLTTIQRFKNELRLAHKITHRNVARLYEFHRAGEAVYLSMEYVEGESLRAMLRRTGKLDVATGLDMARQLAAGLAEAHRHSIAHRDLKPENIILAAEGELKVMDFGISRSYDANVTATGGVLGTPAYMAPEQAEGKPADHRTDIYAFGLILYEMFTGAAAFRADTPVALALKQIRERPEPPRTLTPELPAHVEQAILKCLEKDPADRFQSVEELLGALEGKRLTEPGRSALRLWLVGAVAAILLAGVVFYVWKPAGVFRTSSPAQPAGARKMTSVEGITEYSFANGLRVLLFPDPSKPKVTVNITYLVGSRHEGYGETGMAHLLEHMNYIQTKTRRNLKQELTDHGAIMNGTTTWDRTNYFETLNASDENLRWALEFEADRMVNTRIEKALLDTEMTVVRNEFEMGESNPDGVLMQRALESAFLWHSYGHSPIGNRSDIEHVPIDRLAAFYRKYYQPDNAILVVAGRFDEPKTLAWIADTLGKVPRPQRKLEPTYTVEPAQDGERSVTLRRAGDTQSIVALYHIPAASHPDLAAIEVLSGVLGDTPSGRLYKALVDTKKTVSAAMSPIELHDPGVLMAAARLRQEQSIDDARKILIDTVEGLVKAPPTRDEVERIKTKYLKLLELQIADSQQVALILSETAADGDWRLLFLGRDNLKRVTEQDVLRVAKAYLKESNRTIGQFIPDKNPDRAEIPEAPEISTLFKDGLFRPQMGMFNEAVSEGEVFDPSPANIEARVLRSKLPNGMKLVLLPKKTRGGTVSVSLTLRFADEKTLFGKGAVAQMAGGLLMHGTRNKSRQQIQDAIDQLKAQITVTGVGNSASASVETVAANLPGALRLVAELLREPSFPNSEFETVRQQRIATLESGKGEPQSLALNALQRRLSNFPRGDFRYVATPEEQIGDLKKVTLDDVRKFHQQFYGISEGEFAVSGQFDPQEIQKLADELLGSWKAPIPYQRPFNPYHKAEAVNLKIETPDKQNAMLIGGLNMKLSDDDPDYPAVVLAHYILGGSATSRLNTRIRNQEGLSYAVQSNLVAATKDDGGSFMGLAMSAPQNSPKVEASFRDEIAKTLKDGFTADEVAAAKKAWLQERYVPRSQDQTLVSLLASRERFDRTLKFDESVEARVAALTAAQVTEALRRHVDVGAMVYVKAGDFKKVGVYQ